MGHESRLNPFARDTQISLPNTVLDCFGRSIREGDQLLIEERPALRQTFRVLGIAPVVDPKLPPNLMEVVLQRTVRFLAAKGQPAHEFLRVLQAANADDTEEVSPESAGEITEVEGKGSEGGASGPRLVQES